MAVIADRARAHEVGLHPRLVDALLAVSRGETVDETAHREGRSRNTVKTHRGRLFAALGARSSAHAVALAFAAGVLTVPRHPE